ncbi:MULTISPECIES: DUF5063 domain-containing protein [unclassified Pseudactinotalea]|uniref:DUF5063 domain-containing protein n=1 Tax=unclassified Pseudactinotalea TaxID=2649176 RepID=UPI00128B3B30|nr:MULTISPECIES: DUF5063 domain-containing protein [unclassified Pseudactinotalea]MPV48977.1 DUF5063 domain-containing protein [Pseudactinotalea sp. HY160]QGH68345.1 DUF5063 domain-containing protein [Pseudactinotalea sp. HY158]
MPDTPAPLGEDLVEMAHTTAALSSHYLDSLTEVASGANPDAAIPVLLLAATDLSAAGARLGAIEDVVPAHRFEPDDGPDLDVEPLRTSLVNVLGDLDGYTDVTDPLIAPELTDASLVNDLAETAAALALGLRHYRAGHLSEALWWWQLTYLSTWGDRALAVSRALLALISHLRLDVDDDTALAAQIDALNAD